MKRRRHHLCNYLSLSLPSSLQVNQGKAGLEEDTMKGRLSELSATLLEVMQRYTSQGDMLAEIWTLHSR